jgi:hypothetical protein
MKYPDCVLTKNQKGELEVRRFLRHGEFVEYDYIDPETGKQKENGKRKIVLKVGNAIESYFIIPLKNGRALLIKEKEEKDNIMVWDGKKAVKLWE